MKHLGIISLLMILVGWCCVFILEWGTLATILISLGLYIGGVGLGWNLAKVKGGGK